MTFIQLACGTFTINRNSFAAEISDRLLLHGLTQKAADALADMKRADYPTDDAFNTARAEAVQRVLDALQAGNWGRSRTARLDPDGRWQMGSWRRRRDSNPR